jgi:X-X-X-Leu-X-X-Gly heptad repeat protein
MAGLVSGIFANVGGNSAKRDRSDYLNSQTRMGNVFNQSFGFGQGLENRGEATTGQGLQDLGTSGNLFRRLTSGNRAATTEAMAPQINAVESQGDADRRQQAALGTARGGGAAGVNQDAKARRMAQIDNMLFGAQTGAAKELGDIGRTEVGTGLGETGQGIGAVAGAGGLASKAGEMATGSRELSDKLHQQSVQQLSNSFEDLLSGFIGEGTSGQDFLSKIPFIKNLI